MKIRVIIYCIFLSAITFVGCDKQEDDILVSAAGELSIPSSTPPIVTTYDFDFPFAISCLDEVPFVLAGHTYLDLSEHYNLSFSVARNRGYKGGYKIGGISEKFLHTSFEFVDDIIWTVSNTKSSMSADVYHGPNFSHTFLHREEYSINCEVSLLGTQGDVYVRSYDFCIVRNTRDEGENIPNNVFDFVEWIVPLTHLRGSHTPVQYTCGNFQDNLCGGGGNSLISVLP